MPTDLSRREAKHTQGYSQQSKSNGAGRDGQAKSVQTFNLKSVYANDIARPSASINDSTDTVDQAPLNEEVLIEQRRKKREAIKAKYRGATTPMMAQALHLNDKSVLPTPNQQGDQDGKFTRSGKSHALLLYANTDFVSTVSPIVSTPATPGTPKEIEVVPSSGVFDISSDRDLANSNGEDGKEPSDDGPSAADYDPTMDMREDRRRDDQRHDEMSSVAYDETKPSIEQDVLLSVSDVSLAGPAKKAKDDFDMFASDDEDDMFAETPAKVNGEVAPKADQPSVAVPIPEARELDIGMLDNWDDPEGYYKIILGELLNGRYHVQANLGQGMFSGVVRAMDVTTKKMVAIKLIRNNETM